jgi:hypothetical protein
LPLSNEDAKEQTILDRQTQIAEAEKDRRNRTIVSIISAFAAIIAGYAAVVVGINKLSGSGDPYTFLSTAGPSGLQSVLRVERKTGRSWILVQEGTTWALKAIN